MKKTIGGRQYDTATARALARWSDGYPAGHRCYCEETLYRTRAGLYFVHGVGGPDSQYADTGRGLPPCSGERILPMTLDTAAGWLALRPSRMNYDSMAIQRLLEPERPVTILKPEALLVMIPVPMKDLLRAEASRRRVSVTTVVLEAIGAYLG